MIMTRNFIPGKDDHYKFTRSEYAQLLHITTNALRMRMRHGKYGSEYVVKNGNYLFKRPRDNTDGLTRGQMPLPPVSKIKKKYNRGATRRGEAKYTNDAFRRANEVKALNKIRRNLGDEYTDEINEEVIKIAQERVIRKKDKVIKQATEASIRTPEPVPYGVDTTPAKYGHMLNATGIKAAENEVHAKLARRWNYFNSSDYSPGGSIFFGNFGRKAKEDKEGVEIDPRDFPPDDRDPEFKNKIEEDIWRLKNKK